MKAFASYVAYIIGREIDIHDKTSKFSPENLIKSGRLSQTIMQEHEHLVPISVQVNDYSDSFVWDITNADNNPQEFAA